MGTPEMKRQRVPKACEKCRALKAKCDGQQPTCGRCTGYGFTCSWAARRTSTSTASGRREEASPPTPTSPAVGEGWAKVSPRSNPADLRWVSESYEALIHSMRSKLDGSERAAVDITLEYIRKQLPGGLAPPATTAAGKSASTKLSKLSQTPAPVSDDQPGRNSSYLGKASDICFLNTVREFMRDGADGTGPGGAGTEPPDEVTTQSYDQSDDRADASPALGKTLKVPSLETAQGYLDIYFSTIHVAYPFLCRPMVLHHLKRIWRGSVNEVDDRPWLALLNSIFAIGAYYSSFPAPEARDAAHFQYFEQALHFSNQLMANCTLTTVWLLLTQCFFLLATCKTDRCWNTLGFAIRMGQSLGLHVEASRVRSRQSDAVEHELRRRTWYAMYVLDRLLALQLGRPVAIHEADFDVQLPSREAESEDEKGETVEALTMDYFLRVIGFSHILGQVIQELYVPTQLDSPPEGMLLSTLALDRTLASWKAELPRHLRFDLGHTFEKSITFKRQRNMLAVKFHHLRALIHRPFLCLPWLQRHKPAFIDLLQRGGRSQIERAERICISEAQQTAHLLHNLDSERSLVHDFPWWQMIPCLICASSILLIASAFASEDRMPETLVQDAETCLKVFDALSINSPAASKATDMLKGLKGLKGLQADQLWSRLPQNPLLGSGIATPNVLDDPSVPFPPPLDFEIPDWQAWPSEISDTMEWSAQFLQPAYLGNAETGEENMGG